MSAAHRHTTPDRPADASSSHTEAPHTRIDTGTRADDASLPPVSLTDHDHTDSDLAARIERTQLRTRVAALERELAASRRRRQAIVDQYERVLEDREGRADESNGESGAVESTQPAAPTRAAQSRRRSRTDPLTAIRRALSSVRR